MAATNETVPPRPIRHASALVAAAVTIAALDALQAVVGLRQVNAEADTFIRLMYDQGQGRAVVLALRGGLRDNIALGVAVAVLLLPLVFAVRRPSRRIRVVVWVLPVAALAVLGCGLATGPEINSFSDGIQDPDALRSWHHLVPGWYNNTHAIAAFLIIGALTAAALLLTRRELADFYTPSAPQTGSSDLWSHMRREDTQPS